MKLIYDIDSKPEFLVEESVNEETGHNEKKYRIKGIFSTIGQKNRNGRTYPMNLWETQVNKYQDNLKSGSINCLMEYTHPARTNVDPMKAVAKIDKLYIQDNYVMGEATLLDNSEANQLKSLIDNGIKISVSSRGVGNVKNGIVESFNLITYDIVPDPSDYNATMNGLVESYQLNEGIVKDLDFDINGNKLVYASHETIVNECEEIAKHDTFTNSEIMTGIETLFKKHISALVEKNNKPFVLNENEIVFNDSFKFTEKHLVNLYNKLNENKSFDLNDRLCFSLKSFVNALSINDKLQINEMVEKLEYLIKPNSKYLINNY